MTVLLNLLKAEGPINALVIDKVFFIYLTNTMIVNRARNETGELCYENTTPEAVMYANILVKLKFKAITAV